MPLSVGSPRLGVTKHLALWSSDFPRQPKPSRTPNCRGRPAYSIAILLENAAQIRRNAALREFELALLSTEANKEGLNNLGSACAETGYLAEAAAYYERSLRIDPGYDLGLRNLSRAYAELGRHGEAYELVDRLVAINKSRPDDVRLGANCLVKIGRVDDAVENLLDLARERPGDAVTYRALGFVYLHQKRASEVAERYFATSLVLDPDQPDLEVILRQAQTPRSTPDMAGPELPQLPSVNPLLPNVPKPVLPAPPR